MKMKNKIIPKTMLDCIALIPKEQYSALLIRHSIRYPILPGTLGNDIPLTPEGIQLAIQLGEKINRPICQVVSSPVGRCIETGNSIIKGEGLLNEVIVEQALVGVNTVINDFQKAKDVFLKNGPFWVINKLLINQSVDGMIPIHIGKKNVINLLFKEQNPGCIRIFISHDYFIAAVIYSLINQKRIDESNIPWMLEGCFFWKDKDKLCMAWRGKTYYIDDI